MTEQPTEGKPKVYLVIEGRTPIGDVSGMLVTPEDGPLWAHTSSHLDWLRHDLLVAGGHQEALDAKYPDGYDVVLIDGTPLPADIARYFGVQ